MAGLGSISPTTDINTNPLAAATMATQYGVRTQQALRQSQYLADALKQLSASGQDIKGGWGELGAKLLAQAILSRKNNQGQDALIKAMGADQSDESDRLLAALRPPTGAPDVAATPAAMGPAPPQPEAPPPLQAQPTPAPQPEPQVAAGPTTPTQTSAFSPADRDALTRMLATEAIGEGPQGMAAAGHVAMNRLRAGYGGGKSIAEIVNQPHQFTGMGRANQVSPQDYATAQQVADGILTGKLLDPTNGAQAFLNPELTQKLYGRIPAWAQGGDGHRIGNHVFFGGHGAPQQVSSAEPPPPPAPPAPGQDVPVETSAQTAAAGANPFPDSAPVTSSPSAAGTAPAGVSPQAPPAGATGAADWPNWKPSQQEMDYVHSLLNSPRDHAAGVALAQHYRQKMTEPEEAQIVLINGAPFYVPKDPTSAAKTHPIPVPQGAMTHQATPEQMGVSAPPGTSFSVDPLGNAKVLTQPSTGQMATSKPGQPYAESYIPGSVQDPTRPQAPQQGYRYAAAPGNPTARQEAVPGSGQDPHAPMNVAQGAQQIQGKIQPLLDLVVVAKQSHGAVQEGFKQQNGTGDIAMVNGLQHLIDKGVVRGEDVNMQMKSNGLEGSLGSITQMLKSAGLLTPEVRAKVLRASDALFTNIDQQYKAQVLAHRPTFDALYGDGGFDKFVMPLGYQRQLGWAAADGSPSPPPPPSPQQQPVLTPGSRDAALAEAKRRGLVP